MEENNTIEQQADTEQKDELRTAIEKTMDKIRTQGMLLGARVMLQTVLDKISDFERKPGSKSNNDHKRLIKDIKQFCERGLSRKIDLYEENQVENEESETAQN